ncbi:hypothetical protein C475_08857 [Halosimplex carlsbadense 2-9-1]|uniref:Uncharacterized protein n=1 Tax=Halosimplex carlsbadense 2-9-1 TaxID=797114 RepID=M0CV98_9EURY|nr:hypothetical protein [Halosimplex carlsbadense]ELZ26523.1 hypothetical protein C475_08857 [Halosimplex carlsbadense 2-9-1]
MGLNERIQNKTIGDLLWWVTISTTGSLTAYQTAQGWPDALTVVATPFMALVLAGIVWFVLPILFRLLRGFVAFLAPGYGKRK